LSFLYKKERKLSPVLAQFDSFAFVAFTVVCSGGCDVVVGIKLLVTTGTLLVTEVIETEKELNETDAVEDADVNIKIVDSFIRDITKGELADNGYVFEIDVSFEYTGVDLISVTNESLICIVETSDDIENIVNVDGNTSIDSDEVWIDEDGSKGDILRVVKTMSEDDVISDTGDENCELNFDVDV
jgi:hypothetical protein